MTQYAIVAIGYNRPRSMERLLKSLAQADYDGDQVTLIISIDNSGDDSVQRCAEDFDWPFGPKIVKTYPQRMGLRRHVLTCGDLVEGYEAIAVFEDDIYVAPNFYQYMKQAVAYYERDDRIAGISLYQHLWNVHANRPFVPLADSNDVYFVQFAQSWGQVWMKRQWMAFRKWYEEQGEEFQESEDIPDYVASWPGTSWLKYHVKYCIERNKYFVYPYVSQCTNFTDAGENFAIPSTGLQVPFQTGIQREYRFVTLDDSDTVYDAFWENEKLAGILGLPADQLCTDLYGVKKNRKNQRYWLTLEIKDYKIVRSFGLLLKPQEQNILADMEGTQIFLYDTAREEKNPYRHHVGRLACSYDFRGDNLSVGMLKNLMVNKVNRQLRHK